VGNWRLQQRQSFTTDRSLTATHCSLLSVASLERSYRRKLYKAFIVVSRYFIGESGCLWVRVSGPSFLLLLGFAVCSYLTHSICSGH
jgi:hypothetical protein